VGSLSVKFGAEVLLHGQPLAVMVDLAAPTADTEEVFEVIEAVEQATGGEVDEEPDQADHEGASDDAAPLETRRSAVEDVGEVEKLRGPSKGNQDGEADVLLDEDRAGVGASGAGHVEGELDDACFEINGGAERAVDAGLQCFRPKCRGVKPSHNRSSILR